MLPVVLLVVVLVLVLLFVFQVLDELVLADVLPETVLLPDIVAVLSVMVAVPVPLVPLTVVLLSFVGTRVASTRVVDGVVTMAVLVPRVGLSIALPAMTVAELPLTEVSAVLTPVAFMLCPCISSGSVACGFPGWPFEALRSTGSLPVEAQLIRAMQRMVVAISDVRFM